MVRELVLGSGGADVEGGFVERYGCEMKGS